MKEGKKTTKCSICLIALIKKIDERDVLSAIVVAIVSRQDIQVRKLDYYFKSCHWCNFSKALNSRAR